MSHPSAWVHGGDHRNRISHFGQHLESSSNGRWTIPYGAPLVPTVDPALDSPPSPQLLQPPAARNPSMHHATKNFSFLASPSEDIQAIPQSILQHNTRSGDEAADPLVRFWRSDDEPWNPQHAARGSEEVPSISQNRQAQLGNVRNHSSHCYREPARSEPGSYISNSIPDMTGRQRSDSGYATKPSHATTQSVYSADLYPEQGQDSQSLASEINGMGIQSEEASQDLFPDDQFHVEPQDVQPMGFVGYTVNEPHRTQTLLVSLNCTYPGCNIICKTQSELKKHSQRHGKPHKCTEAGCTRAEGFSTKNDLDRHKKSLHQIIPPNGADRSFRCLGINCTKKDKVWPRLDNFKSHCQRMHKNENIDELVKKSEVETTEEPISEQAEAEPALPSFASVSSDHVRDVNRSNLTKSSAVEGIWRLSGSSTSTEQYYRTALNGGGTDIDQPRRNRPESIVSDHSRSVTPAQQLIQHPERLYIHKSTQRSINPLCSPQNAQYQDLQIKCSGTQEALPEFSQPSSSSLRHPKFSDLANSPSEVDRLSKLIANDVANSLKSNQTSAQDIELIIQARVLALMNPSSFSKRSSEDAQLDDLTRSHPAKRVTCRSCNKTMDRQCDLKKHEKRHTRPWGCTHTTCSRTFGSKNDWKRHENSQHHQMETWRCAEPYASSNINHCSQLFYRRDHFQVHLRDDHGRDDYYIRGQLQRNHIGLNGQCGFWCGFCKEIIQLRTEGLEAKDERFNHIDDMHFKQGRSIDEWFPPDRDINKRRLRIESQRGDIQLAMDEDTDSEESGTRGSSGEGGRTHARRVQLSISPYAVDAALYEGMKRTEGHGKESSGWYCCICGEGPNNPKILVSCLNGTHSRHNRCKHCQVEPPNDEYV